MVFRFPGYSIFIVVGEFPMSEADQILKVVQAIQPVKPRLLSDKSKPATEGATGQFVDDDLAIALEESKRLLEDDDQSLKRALAMSMQGQGKVTVRARSQSEQGHSQGKVTVRARSQSEQGRSQGKFMVREGQQGQS